MSYIYKYIPIYPLVKGTNNDRLLIDQRFSKDHKQRYIKSR